MFEEGARLKAEHGAEKVFDFTLGNPNLEPPDEFHQTLHTIIQDSSPGMHGYMPNAGYPFVRKAIADTVAREYQIPLTEKPSRP